MLNKIIHQPIRIEIIALIISNEVVSFTTLKDELEVTFGNLFIHLEKLEKAEYIKSIKKIKNKRSHTIYSMTQTGIKEFYTYIDEVESIINQCKDARDIKSKPSHISSTLTT